MHTEPNLGQINDLAAKLDSWDTNSGRGGYSLNQEGADKKAEDKLGKATKDSCKITTEVLHGIMTQVKIVKKYILPQFSFIKAGEVPQYTNNQQCFHFRWSKIDYSIRRIPNK